MDRARAWLERQRGSALVEQVALQGGMGARRYWRLRFANGASAVLMHAVPEEPAILPPALRAERGGIPFVEVTALLRRHGLPAPEIYAVEAQERWVLLEDLGDRHLLDLTPGELERRLLEAGELLARVHALPREDALPFRRVFDAEWVRFELRTFAEHGLAPRWHAALAPELDRLAEAVEALPRVLCLRDYQSQNLMIDAHGRLRVLDYQDALLAPPELDLAAFVHDSYLERTPALRTRLLERYWTARGAAPDPAAFALLVVQRKCKDYGRYRYMCQVKGETRWAPYIARAAASVGEVLPALPRAHSALARILSEAMLEPRA
jgi:aminoglycoside/choline kinase family phosphotransferase